MTVSGRRGEYRLQVPPAWAASSAVVTWWYPRASATIGAGMSRTCWRMAQARPAASASSSLHVSTGKQGHNQSLAGRRRPLPSRSANPAGMPAVSLYLIPVYRPPYRYTGKPAALGGDMKNITESELAAQYQRANSLWPFIHQTELARGLPRMLLFAVGSRETNLTNEVGDGGHGHGVWQLDNRSHNPPGGFAAFDHNVPLQCAIAAGMLQALLAIRHGNVQEAAAMYNSGRPDDAHTTGKDYGTDVVQRMGFLQQKFGNIVRFGGPPPAWFHRNLGLAS